MPPAPQVSRLKGVSMATKLAGAFGVLVVGLVIAIVVAISGMNSMNAVHRDVVNIGEAKALAGPGPGLRRRRRRGAEAGRRVA